MSVNRCRYLGDNYYDITHYYLLNISKIYSSYPSIVEAHKIKLGLKGKVLSKLPSTGNMSYMM